MGRLVYATDQGRLCPDCRQALCQCQANHQAPIGDGHVRICFTTKGRKGKGVTTISGLPLAQAELLQLYKELKQKTSVGGTIKNGIIELQGDQCNKLIALLSHRGYASVKLSGS